MRTAISLALATFIAIPAGAVKPPPPSGTTSPEIAYVQISGGARRNYTLRLANEDGTGANSIYSSRDTGQMVPHMGPRAGRTILLVQGSKISLVRYEPTSTGTKLASIEQLPGIGPPSTGAREVAFSPDGTKLVSFAQNDMKFWVFDLNERSMWPLIQLTATPRSFAFSRDGSAIVYLDHVSDTEAVLKKFSLAGGGTVELGISGNFSRVRPANQSDGFILVRGSDVTTSRIEWHPAGGGAAVDLAQGYEPSLQCDDSTVIYQKLNSGGSVALLRVEVATKQGYTTSSSGNYSPDYVGC